MLLRLCLLLIVIRFQVTGLKAQEIDYARHVVKKLSSRALHGRGYGFNGDGKAARFLEGEFRKHGVSPLNSGYHQWFDITANTFPGAASISTGSGNLIPGIDFLPDPSSPGLNGSFHLQRITAADILSGKADSIALNTGEGWLLLLDLIPDEIPGDKQKKQVDYFKKSLQNNSPFQASGVIEMVKDLSWHISGECMEKPWILIRRSAEMDISVELRIKLDNQYLTDRKTSNVIGYFKGNCQPDSFIVFTAHYDHLGSLGRKTWFPGANDNASGVAMMLQLMQYYKAHPPSYSTVFIATSAEELGLLGSRYFVDNPMIDLKKIRFLLNFDLVGTGEDGIMVVNALVFQREFASLSHIKDQENLVPSIQRRGESCNSDHCPFYYMGVPCFFIYTLGGNPAYHQPSDSPESISMKAFGNCVKLMIKFTDFLTR
jgi:hypothetical protein